MKEKGILLLTVLLAGALINSTGFVVAQTDSTGSTNSTDSTGSTNSTGSTGSTNSTGSTGSTNSTGSTGSTNSTGSTGSTNSTSSTVSTGSTQDKKETICHFPPGNPSNAHTITIGISALPAHIAHGDTIGPCDGVIGGTGGTGDIGPTGNATAIIGNLDQYVSEFVHERKAMFKQQRAETIGAIKDCRKDVRNADNEEDGKEIQEACKEKLKAIREKYKAERKEYRQLFKEHRDSMKILIKEAKGHGVSAEEKEKAMKDINEIKATKEKMKEERQATKEQMKEERQAKNDKKEK